ncbi:aa3-type cytochrome c oxidase subunit IV [Octadecabacter antarcticus]|nr:aa3-type cytochrome c oxidase subunit IV [Octadecabacter antarcticus]
MPDHKHGEMDISVQEKTFNGFMSMVTKIAVIIVISLILLALING